MSTDRLQKVLKAEGVEESQQSAAKQGSTEKVEALSEAPKLTIKVWDKTPTSVRRYVMERLILLGVLITLYFIWVGYWLIGVGALIGILLYLYLLRLPPRELTLEIDVHGVKLGQQAFLWEGLVDFWIAEKDGFYIVYFTTKTHFPNVVAFVVKDFIEARALATAVSYFIPYRKVVEQNLWDRFTYGRYVFPHELGDVYEHHAAEDMVK